MPALWCGSLPPPARFSVAMIVLRFVVIVAAPSSRHWAFGTPPGRQPSTSLAPMSMVRYFTAEP